MSARAPSWFIGFPFPHRAAIHPLPIPPPKVRVFGVEDLHMTLAFLGPCGEDPARAAFATIDARAIEPLALFLDRAELLGNPRHPTAIARRLAGEDEARLAVVIGRARGQALEEAGAPPEVRAPLPHLTIARIGRRASNAERTRAKAWMAAILPRPEALAITEVALYTRADPALADREDARLYRVVDRKPLGVAPVRRGA